MKIARYLEYASRRKRLEILDRAYALGQPIFEHVLKLSLYGDIDQS